MLNKSCVLFLIRLALLLIHFCFLSDASPKVARPKAPTATDYREAKGQKAQEESQGHDGPHHLPLEPREGAEGQ